MYESLIHPWSPPHLASAAEQAYRAAGLLRTKGTIFLLPPPHYALVAAYNAPPRPKTRMSSGAVALCKHFERGDASSEHGRSHPYWALPVGGNQAKTRIAEQVLNKLLAEVVWKNVMLLHPGIAVYEVRNGRGFGMRWTLDVVDSRKNLGEKPDMKRDGIEGAQSHSQVVVDARQDEVGESIRSHIADGIETEEKSHSNEQVFTNNAEQTDTEATDDANTPWMITKTTFRGFVEPIEGMDHEVDNDPS